MVLGGTGGPSESLAPLGRLSGLVLRRCVAPVCPDARPDGWPPSLAGCLSRSVGLDMVLSGWGLLLSGCGCAWGPRPGARMATKGLPTSAEGPPLNLAKDLSCAFQPPNLAKVSSSSFSALAVRDGSPLCGVRCCVNSLALGSYGRQGFHGGRRGRPDCGEGSVRMGHGGLSGNRIN